MSVGLLLSCYTYAFSRFPWLDPTELRRCCLYRPSPVSYCVPAALTACNLSSAVSS